MGLYLWVMYKTYMRPGECRGLLGCQLIPPTQAAGKAFGFWAILLHPTELGVPGKTNLFDESLVWDTDPWAGELFNMLKSLSGEDGKIWPFDHDILLAIFQLAARALRLDPLKPCLYAIRHGGASDDLLQKKGSFLEVKQRGRWAADNSLKRYGKMARALSELAKVPTATIQFGREIGKLLPEILVGRSLVTPPPGFSQSVEFNDRMQELFRK